MNCCCFLFLLCVLFVCLFFVLFCFVCFLSRAIGTSVVKMTKFGTVEVTLGKKVLIYLLVASGQWLYTVRTQIYF